MKNLYPEPALELVAYFPAGRLALLALPGAGPDGRPGDRVPLGNN
jgi:hypothetical protein